MQEEIYRLFSFLNSPIQVTNISFVGSQSQSQSCRVRCAHHSITIFEGCAPNMPDYRRSRDGRTYFFTVVAYMRQPILCLGDSMKALEETTMEVQQDRPFEIKAWVILPDHLHAIWELPDGDSDYSTRWSLIKKGFTKKMKGRHETPALNGSSPLWTRGQASGWKRFG